MISAVHAINNALVPLLDGLARIMEHLAPSDVEGRAICADMLDAAKRIQTHARRLAEREEKR